MEKYGGAMAIIHIDMDAFFASVEQRDNPQLQDRPVAVGGTPQQRGVVAAASYEARQFGVRSAMPMAKAIQLCPELLILPVNLKKYRRVSQLIMEIFISYTPLVEPISLDEAFLDVYGCERLFGSAEEIGRQIQMRISDEVQLTASVGIGPNKFIAKLASDYRKPNGFTVVPQGKVLGFLDPLPIEKMWGVGKKTSTKLKRMGISTIGQLRGLAPGLLEETLGKNGRVIYEFAHGRDTRPVQPNRAAKSIGKEVTFAKDVRDMDMLGRRLRELTEEVARSLRKNNLSCSTVTLKIKYPDQKLVTRSISLTEPTDLTGTIYNKAVCLLEQHCRPPVRLIGITCGRLSNERMATLFPDQQKIREEKIDRVLDKLKDLYGEDIVKAASLLPGDDDGS